METNNNTVITVETIINAPVEKVWESWTLPEHIVKWNFASPDWHTTQSENDLREGGKFTSRMEAKDGSMGFDFWGVYTKIILHQFIESILGDGRRVTVEFINQHKQTKIRESFEAENIHDTELQRMGWQSILDNFKLYTESL